VSLIGLADDLPWIARHFEHLWDEWEPPQRQQLINACIARMEVAITPAPTPQPYRREVAQIEHEEWLQPFFGNCAA
jgi:hypothetical protein